MPWKNFSIWRGRLPHWRADDVTYWVTFRHRRDLEAWERNLLFTALLRPEGRKWNLVILCVLPGETNLLFTVNEAPSGQAFELSDVVEKAKTKAGKAIIKKTEERFPPFYQESYDRIIRDAEELEQRLLEILESPVKQELAEDPEEWDCLWVAGRD
jgi:putative transposase